jgi:hypothetical protein
VFSVKLNTFIELIPVTSRGYPDSLAAKVELVINVKRSEVTFFKVSIFRVTVQRGAEPPLFVGSVYGVNVMDKKIYFNILKL